MKLIYRSSVEKWEGLTKIALFKFNDEELAWRCQDLADYIKSVCDVKLDWCVEFRIDTYADFHEAIHDDTLAGCIHPCPHCYVYKCECEKCPLKGDILGNRCKTLWIKVAERIEFKI